MASVPRVQVGFWLQYICIILPSGTVSKSKVGFWFQYICISLPGGISSKSTGRLLVSVLCIILPSGTVFKSKVGSWCQHMHQFNCWHCRVLGSSFTYLRPHTMIFSVKPKCQTMIQGPDCPGTITIRQFHQQVHHCG